MGSNRCLLRVADAGQEDTAELKVPRSTQRVLGEHALSLSVSAFDVSQRPDFTR